MREFKFILISLLVIIWNTTSAQSLNGKNKRKPNPIAADKPSKWVLGVKVGLNQTRITVGDRYSVLGRAYTKDGFQKQYLKKNRYAPHFAFITTYFPVKNLGVTFQPGFFSYSYDYKNRYDWMSGESSVPYYQLQFRFQNNLNYLEFPLMAKYYLINGGIHAFIQGGGFYGKLLSAKKSIDTKGIDSPGPEEIVSFQQSKLFGVSDSYIKIYTGWMVGAGTGFKLDNFRFALEINYRKGINNVTSEKNRYQNNQIMNGYYDVPDNLTFRNVEISVSSSIPVDNLVHVASKKKERTRAGKRF